MNCDIRSIQHSTKMSSDDDSDNDLVTDYLCLASNKNGSETKAINNNNKPPKSAFTTSSTYEHNKMYNNNNINNNINMVPTISVTPHSPGTKYNFLEDTLNYLQDIRESVVQITNANVRSQHYATSNLINPSLSSPRLFSSCPSLPDLTAATCATNNMWPTQEYRLNSDRRKSWTAIEDLTECTKHSHKSISLSSLDSEEQESLRVAEILHNRNSRNSTGGISTHSLNEAELARDFERINAKRNLVPQLQCRIPLQKSISTPSIAPIRSQHVKEENTIQTSRHLSDSEDDNQDERSLLCVRDKNEVYADLPEKRRKRGSLFFRKKKDKSKTKGQSTNCDACGTVINLSTYKDHAIECKAKIVKSQQNAKGSNKKSSTQSHASFHHHHQDDASRDYYDGHSHNENINNADDVPLIKNEILSEPHITSQNLCSEPILGMQFENEPETWSPSVPKEIVKSLTAKQVKRQEHIYELIITEKRHCQILLLMQKVFAESLRRHFSNLNLDRLFPKLQELTDLHTGFLKKLRLKQKESFIVDSVADILLDFFSGSSAQKLKDAYGEFCSNHKTALETFKDYQTGDQTFAEWHKHKQTNHLLKRKGIPECTLFVVQRLTKYPILIEDQLKSSKENPIEQEKFQKANALVKEILVEVNSRVAEKDNLVRRSEIFKRIDAKSFTFYKKDKFKKSDIMDVNRQLKFEGTATLMQGRSKMQTVIVVVLTDCLFFLQENSQKYTFFTPENKAGVVSLQKLLIREKAGTESRGIYIISSNPAYPEMYELKVQDPKDKNIWIQSIRAAVKNCPTDDSDPDEYLTSEQKQMMPDVNHASIRELISLGNSELQDKMRQKDLEQAILLEHKVALQASYLHKAGLRSSGTIEPDGIDAFLSSFASYKELITDDCDTVEITKRVFQTVHEISQLASNLYKSATGYDLPMRSFSSVGERQSDAYQSPKLPTRAETFGGFDERKNKLPNQPWRDVISTINNTIAIHNKDNHDKRDSCTSETDTINIPTASSNYSTRTVHDHNYEALQVSHHLHTLLCIINQQMTTITSLQSQINAYRDNPKLMYRHNDQLEELRNLQDKLQEEKTVWLKQKEMQERELDERRQHQETLQKQIRAEQEDIRQQREQLYRKMEKLSSQGILLSANVTIPNPLMQQQQQGFPYVDEASSGSMHSDDTHHHHQTDGALTIDKRKDKWRSASISKAPPVNLLSATNAPKVNQSSIKQQLPLKLSSLSSSTKSEKTSNNNILTSPTSSTSGNIMGGGANNTGNASSVIQMLPLKLADKKNQTVTPNHSRTGSSPAVFQKLNATHSGNPAIRTNTYPKLPERYRLRNSDGGTYSTQIPTQQMSAQQRNIYGSTSSSSTPTTPPPTALIAGQTIQQQQQKQQQPQGTLVDGQDQNQEEIYF